MAVDVLITYLPVKFGSGKTYGLPPLGVYALASTVAEKGMSVSVLDASIKGLSFDETIEAITSQSPKLVGISMMTPHLRSTKQVVDALNAAGYKGKICLGGAHLNATGDEVMDYIDVDFAFKGESEFVFPEFAEKFLSGEDWKHISNLIYKSETGTISNPEGDFIQDLDEIPFPDLGFGDPNDYEIIYGKYDKTTTLMASRGCPYRCTFCDVFAAWGRKLRLRTPANVLDEIEFNMSKYGFREFVFKDSTFDKWLVFQRMPPIDQGGTRYWSGTTPEPRQATPGSQIQGVRRSQFH